MVEAHSTLPPSGPPNPPSVGKLDGIGKLMLRIAGATNPKGMVGDLLEFGVEASVRKGHAELDGWEEALRGPQGGGEVGVSGYDHESITGPQVKELDGLHPQGNVGLLFFVAFDSCSAVRTGEVFALETGDVEIDTGRFQGLQVFLMPTHHSAIIPVKVERERCEEMDVFEGCLLADRVKEGLQKPMDVQPAEGKELPSHFRLADRVIKVEPINQERHAVRHRTFPENKTPPGRNPRGPEEPRWTARGGMFENSFHPCPKSTVFSEASALVHPTAPPSPSLLISGSQQRYRDSPAERKMAIGAGRLDGRISRSGLVGPNPGEVERTP